jgi:hypothetical protein
MDITDPQYKTADGAALRMWRDTAQNKYQSETHGRPLFDDVIFCEVITPGSRDSTPVFELERVFCAEAGLSPKRGIKYAEYEQFIESFKRGEDDINLAGTPLKQWPEMTRSMAATLKAMNVFTLEALSVLPDQKLSQVGPDGRTWREKAKAFLETSKDGAYATQLAAMNERLQADLGAALEREKALAERVTALENASKGGKPGKAATTPPPIDPASPPPVVENPVAPVAAEDETLQLAGDTPKELPII